MVANRTATIAKNSIYSVSCHCATLLVQFIVRTFFIKCLTIEYVGIQGLFSNILMLLSLAEMGMVNAMNFALYKPLANNDQNKIGQIMLFFQKIYRIIAVLVLLLGLSLTPFLDALIKEKPNIQENIYIIFLFFVINSSVSYLFAYKQTLIIADQKKYIVSIYTLIVNVAVCILQCMLLYLYKSFYSYLILMVVCTLLTNVLISIKCNKDYPVLKNCNITPINYTEKKEIYTNIKSLFLYRIGSVILNGTSNIFISKLFGLVILGICSNVYYVVNAGMGILTQVLQSFIATLGNLNAIETKSNKIRAFYKTALFCFWLYGLVCVGFMLFVNDFISIWIGKEYQVDSFILFSIVAVFYMDGVGFPLFAYRSTMGLFSVVKYAPLLASFLNILLSIILAKYIGVAGIYLAIVITRFICINLTDLYVVFKIGLENSKPYKLGLFYIIFIIFSVCMFYTNTYLDIFLNINDSIISLIVEAFLFFWVYNICFIISFHRTELFKELKMNLQSVIKNSNR